MHFTDQLMINVHIPVITILICLMFRRHEGRVKYSSSEHLNSFSLYQPTLTVFSHRPHPMKRVILLPKFIHIYVWYICIFMHIYVHILYISIFSFILLYPITLIRHTMLKFCLIEFTRHIPPTKNICDICRHIHMHTHTHIYNI